MFLNHFLMITPEQWFQVLSAIESGMTNKDACQIAGIHRDSFYAKIKADSDFSDLVKKAKSCFKQVHVVRIADAGKTQWQASAWLLERKFKKEFGKVDKSLVDHTTKGQAITSVTVEVVKCDLPLASSEDQIDITRNV